MKRFTWEVVYKEIAKKLLEYKSNRKQLITIIEDTYNELNMDIPTLEINKKIIDIDPFTIFGLFNRSSTNDKRMKIVEVLMKKLGIDLDVPIDFDSIPVLNPINALYYNFQPSRNTYDIQNLWELFDSALSYAGNPSENIKKDIIRFFDLVINVAGNGNAKVTMGLYWIAPEVYLNLDARNRWFIYESGRLSDDFIKKIPYYEGKLSGKLYFEILEVFKEYFKKEDKEFGNLKELSQEAWRYSTKVNEQKKNNNSEEAFENINETHYWLYTPGENACRWDENLEKGIMSIGWGAIGNLQEFNYKQDMKIKMQQVYQTNNSYKNDSLATWQFAKVMKPGDIVFVKKGLRTIIGYGIVKSDYYYDETIKDTYKNIRDVDWKANGKWDHPWHSTVLKALTDVTKYPDYVEQLLSLFEQEGFDIDSEDKPKLLYSESDFLKDVYITKEQYQTIKGLLESKKNIILQGAPGVGKTYMAKRLAYSILGAKEEDKVSVVQFHQSYSYEDFIEGFRPTIEGNGFDIKSGIFQKFCDNALQDLENKYYFIIDEINRGNLSKIFGELFMLIEADKRDDKLRLLYSGNYFRIPKNVYIIGLMNTADRSLAILDYALRRRFAFYPIEPGFDSEGFIAYQQSLNYENFDNLISLIKQLNMEIINDDSLGEGFVIGHSYFCNIKPEDMNNQVLLNIINYEILPLLREYWFDDKSRLNNWENLLKGVIK